MFILLYIQSICINNISVCLKIKICRIGENNTKNNIINNIMIFVIIIKEIYCRVVKVFVNWTKRYYACKTACSPQVSIYQPVLIYCFSTSLSVNFSCKMSAGSLNQLISWAVISKIGQGRQQTLHAISYFEYIQLYIYYQYFLTIPLYDNIYL